MQDPVITSSFQLPVCWLPKADDDVRTSKETREIFNRAKPQLWHFAVIQSTSFTKHNQQLFKFELWDVCCTFMCSCIFLRELWALLEKPLSVAQWCKCSKRCLMLNGQMAAIVLESGFDSFAHNTPLCRKRAPKSPATIHYHRSQKVSSKQPINVWKLMPKLCLHGRRIYGLFVQNDYCRKIRSLPFFRCLATSQGCALTTNKVMIHELKRVNYIETQVLAVPAAIGYHRYRLLSASQF